MEIGSHRKDSEDFSSQNQVDSSKLFPKIQNFNLTASLEVLKEHYSKELHHNLLGNYCFRCHNAQIIQAYEQFRINEHPELQEPRISNLYQNSAFVDLRKLSKNLKNQIFQIPGPYISPIPQNLNHLLNQVFQHYGFIPNLERFYLYFPGYLQKHLLVQNLLFESDKIDSKIAYFLSLCAAAETGSAYIMTRMVKRFLKEGGNLQWISNAKYPQKYKIILQLNRYMVRAPWEITSDMIEAILQNPNFHWSKNQLALCIQIMAYAHQLSTVALGVGLLPEDTSITILNLPKILALKDAYDGKDYESAPTKENKEKLAVMMIPAIKEIQQEQSEGERVSEFKQEIIKSKKMIKKQIRKVQNIDPYMKEIGNQLTKQELYHNINELVKPLLPPFQLFQKRGEMKNNILDYSDYNYKFMAYPVLHNLTQGVADKIKALIQYSEIMTRGNFGNQKINHTKDFRKAVRYYAENLCGYTHHQYDFKSNVGSYLTMALKFYVRLLALSPLHINSQVIRQTNHESGQQIECFDLGHLAILIANTKMSLEMTMAIQAFEL